MKYVLVSRKGCHLCEEAENLLSTQGIAYEFCNVDGHENLKQYTFRVPVLLLEGQVLIEGKFTPECLARKLS